MKNEQQIRQWANSHTVHENDVHAIMGYLTALDIEIDEDINFNIGAKKECFDSFVEWFDKDSKIAKLVYAGAVLYKAICDNSNITPSKTFQKNILDYMSNGTSLWQYMQPSIDKMEIQYEYMKGNADMFKTLIDANKQLNNISEHKYKVNDWVRFKGDYECYCIHSNNIVCSAEKGNIVQLSPCCGFIGFKFNGSTFIMPPKYIEPAKPKEGEFWCAKGNFIGFNYIFCDNYCTFELRCDCSFCHLMLNDFRPATEAEKQQLIKAVEDKYNKTWNGKEWVHMLKVGDMVIAWNNNKTKAIIGTLEELTSGYINYIIANRGYVNAIKFTS